jgi:hypothetical protein
MQRADCNIAEAVEIWIDLEETLKNVLEKEADKKCLTKRMKGNLTTYHYLANLLSPRYAGRRLSDKQVEDSMTLLAEVSSESVPAVMKYQTKTAPFHNYLFIPEVTREVKSAVWWQTVPGRLLELVAALDSAVNSSASIERGFSTFGLVQSKLRNRLGTVKAGKLVFIYRVLNTGLAQYETEYEQ